MNNSYRFMPNQPYTRPVHFYPNYAQTPRMLRPRLNAPKISFSKILNGTSKTLGVINQAIPVFYQIKPIWNNARTMLRVVKGLNSQDKKASKSEKTINKTPQKKEHSNNAPTFFA